MKYTNEKKIRILSAALNKANRQVKLQEKIIQEYRERVEILSDQQAKPSGLTAGMLMQAMERADIPEDAEIRFEFDGDDIGPQEIDHIEPRTSEGVAYYCIIVRNA